MRATDIVSLAARLYFVWASIFCIPASWAAEPPSCEASYSRVQASLVSPETVEARVPGLYESIPLDFKTFSGPLEVQTSVIKSGRSQDLSSGFYLRNPSPDYLHFSPDQWDDSYRIKLELLEYRARFRFDPSDPNVAEQATRVIRSVPSGKPEFASAAAALILNRLQKPEFFPLRSGSQGWTEISRQLREFRAHPEAFLHGGGEPPPGFVESVRRYLPDPEQLMRDPTLFGHGKSHYPIGFYYQLYVPARKELDLSMASLDYLPEFPETAFVRTDTSIPLVPSRGTPTVVFAGLQQMRMAGIPLGGLRVAKGIIDNAKTGLELLQVPEIAAWMKAHPGEKIPGELIAPAFFSTQIGRFVRTLLVQSGHEISSLKIESCTPTELNRVMPMLRLDPSTKKLLPPGDPGEALIPVGFRFRVELKPASTVPREPRR